MIYDVIIAGGGAAGLYFACGMDKKVNGLILEGSSSPGQKLLISGGGMCNLSHGGSVKDFIPCYFEAGPKIRSCLYKYGNLKLVEFFRDRGLPLYTRDDGKIFPESESAKDVLDVLVRGAGENGFKIMTGHKIYSHRRRRFLFPKNRLRRLRFRRPGPRYSRTFGKPRKAAACTGSCLRERLPLRRSERCFVFPRLGCSLCA